ncbi:hypothetical protein Pint_05672 [Pistacia integerrima]|uniref:Uncharacterized protein n=1 Tax=Pistacia integerrima TaxID=434235 RepID=A0ACC0Z0V8_9ROSI|nr:hypothetical protein Pint_05672 [Pistacia integerrima]
MRLVTILLLQLHMMESMFAMLLIVGLVMLHRNRNTKGFITYRGRCYLRAIDPILENSTDDRWKWFKNCLGALDGTYIRVHVESIDKNRYRTQKNEIATNVLGVCTPDMQFIYVLPE